MAAYDAQGNESALSSTLAATTADGTPPSVPNAPKGPTTWLQGTAYACTTSTTDPTGVQVSYQFDWGDGVKPSPQSARRSVASAA